MPAKVCPPSVHTCHWTVGEGLAVAEKNDDRFQEAELHRLKGELLTIEYGIKRIRQDGLYRLKLKVEEDALAGRDALSLMADNINRQIVKARRRLEHLAE